MYSDYYLYTWVDSAVVTQIRSDLTGCGKDSEFNSSTFLRLYCAHQDNPANEQILLSRLIP
jgi:hypothetical protein